MFGISDVFQAWDVLSGSVLAITGAKSKNANAVDCSYITPAIIALGEFQESQLEEIKRLTKGEPVVFWNLGAREVPLSCRAMFHNQVIDAPWKTPCKYTKAPVLDCVLSLCESVKSWYDLDEKNLVIIHCPPNYPSTGVLVACLLKYIGAFDKAELAYDFYCKQRLKGTTQHSLAPSYRTLFSNVDHTVDNDGYENALPLHLKTITLAGLPVEDIPCLEVWDLSGKVFASHVRDKPTRMCKWDAEYGDGYFQVDANILGDFAVVCRFGGQMASTKEKSTLIFKYQNTTAFLTGDKLELKADHVDINPHYAESMEVETFTMHLAFESTFSEEDHSGGGKGRQQLHALDLGKQHSLAPYNNAGIAGFEAGLSELRKMHSVMPLSSKCAAMVEKGLDEKYAAVALQLANNDSAYAAELVEMMQRRRGELLPTAPDSTGLPYVTAESTESDAENAEAGTAGQGKTPEQMSELNSEDSNWEVVDFKCPVCHVDSADLSDQLIPCAVCALQYHTLCAGLRRIPFTNKTEKDKENREKYVRKHFQDWKCDTCVALAAGLDETESDAGDRKMSSKSSMSSFGSEKGSRRDDASTVVSSGPNSVTRGAAHTMSVPTSRQQYGVTTGGGGVIITDAVRTPVNATGQPFSPLPPSASGRPAVTTGSKAKTGSLLHPTRSVSSEDVSPSGSNKSSPAKPALESSTHAHSGSASLGQSLMSPPAKSKTDQVATLMGLLASHGLSAEDLVGMPEAKQKETLVNLLSSSHGGSLSNSTMSAGEAASKEVKQQDLASALKGLIARSASVGGSSTSASASAGGETPASAVRSKSTESTDGPFDARAAMLEVIRRKAAQSATATAEPATQYGSGSASTGSAGPSGMTPAGGYVGGGLPPGHAGAFVTNGPSFSRGPTINNSEFAKYFKMLKVGIPRHSVAEKLVGEGLVATEKLAMELLDLDPTQPIPEKFFHVPDYNMDSLIPVAEHPQYKKFFKMVKLGLPRDAIKEKMSQEGLEASYLDKPEDALVPQPVSLSGQLLGLRYGPAGGPGGGVLGTGGYGPGPGGGPGGGGNGPGLGGAGGAGMGGNGGGNGNGGQTGPYQAGSGAGGVGSGGQGGGPGGNAGNGGGWGGPGGPNSAPGGGYPGGPGGDGSGPGGAGGWYGPGSPGAGGPGGPMGGLGSPGFGSPGFGSPGGRVAAPLVKGGVQFVAASEHPNYLKFFKMLKSGVAKEVVRQQMQDAGLDATILDREFSDQVPFGDATGKDSPVQEVKVAAQDHPRYASFFKMLKVGLPKQAVMLKMEQEGLDPNVLLNPPETLIPLEVKPAGATDGAPGASGGGEAGSAAAPAAVETVPVSEHPKYVKYFKMLKIGLPAAAVKQKMISEGLDADILDKPAGELIPLHDAPAKPAEAAEEKVPVSEHPKYSKFFKMLKVGLPLPAVKQKAQAEGVDPAILDKDPAELVPLHDKPAPAVEMVAVSQHPKYAKFFKMLKVGLPAAAVKNKMTQEGVDPSFLDKPEDEQIPLHDAPAKEEGEKVPLGEHPKYAKFFKMLKVGLPAVAVKGKMTQEGLDPAMLDRDPTEMVLLNDAPAEDAGPMVAAGEHPAYGKFFKMLKVGLPLVAVKAKAEAEGLDPSVLDKAPTDMIPLNPPKAGAAAAKKAAAAGPKVTKKKLHWKALDADKVKNSLWADDGGEDDGDLHMDEEEFKRLFVMSESAEDKKGDAKKPQKEVKKVKVSLINMKRAQNAGIALARIRFSYTDLRRKINDMDGEGLTTDQLKSLEEFLPTQEEEGLLRAYKGDDADLGQAEQYMKVMSKFPGATKRIRCMIYKQVFRGRVLECKAKLSKIENACDDVKLSGRLKKTLKTILRVGNQLNDGEKHEGFTLDSLLKLQSAKAFDRKTSVLQYVITLICRNDADCLRFPEDLHISDATRLGLDVVSGEIKGIREEFDANFKIVSDIEEKEATSKTGAMVDFFGRAEAMCKDLERGFEAVKKKFNGVLAYFGEEEGMTSTDFFTTLHKFVLEFVSVRDVVERQYNQEQKKAAEMAANAAHDRAAHAAGEKPSRRGSTMGSNAHRHRSLASHAPGGDDGQSSIAESGATSYNTSYANSPKESQSNSPVPSDGPGSLGDGAGIAASNSPVSPAKRTKLLQRRKSSIM